MQMGLLGQIKLNSGNFPNYTNTTFPSMCLGCSFSNIQCLSLNRQRHAKLSYKNTLYCSIFPMSKVTSPK